MRRDEPSEEDLIRFFQDHGWSYGEALDFINNNYDDARFSYFSGNPPMSANNPSWIMPSKKRQPMSGSAAVASRLPPSPQPSPFARPA